VHHSCIDYLLTKERRKIMKNQLTNNQQKAINIFDDQIVAQSDFDGGDYVFINELIDILVNEGWAPKSAEGTIGSLCETSHLSLFEKGGDPFSYSSKDLFWLSV
tara:strand:- start:79 stop:390 length:312 start_codon:yes stop_codon:yes gene_type:complete